MRRSLLITAGLALLSTGHAMAQERIEITSKWGTVTANLADNAAARAFAAQLPLTIEMGDHLRQEKTGNLPTSLPQAPRQLDFAAGTLGLWAPDHFVIYYRRGQAPQPGIVVLGNAAGDVSIFDRPGPITVQVRRAKSAS